MLAQHHLIELSEPHLLPPCSGRAHPLLRPVHHRVRGEAGPRVAGADAARVHRGTARPRQPFRPGSPPSGAPAQTWCSPAHGGGRSASASCDTRRHHSRREGSTRRTGTTSAQPTLGSWISVGECLAGDSRCLIRRRRTWPEPKPSTDEKGGHPDLPRA